MPVMVTGGIRRKVIAEQVIDSGVQMVGIGTALAIEPALPNAWRAGRDTAPALPRIRWKNKALVSLATMATVKFQLRQLSKGRTTNPAVSPWRALLLQQAAMACRARHYRHWVARQTRM